MAKPPFPLQVIARQRGVYGGILREPGERFVLKNEAELGAWMIPCESPPLPKEEP